MTPARRFRHAAGLVVELAWDGFLAHLEEAPGAVDVTPSDKDVEWIESPYQRHPVRGHR